MDINLMCMECLVKRHAANALKLPEEAGLAYMKEALRLIADAAGVKSSPELGAELAKVYVSFGGAADVFEEEKRRSNELMLKLLPELRRRVEATSLSFSLKLAGAANYIDYGALRGEVNEADLMKLLDDAAAQPLKMAEYRWLCSDLADARRLLYIADNAGEIVADRLVVEQLMRHYPELDICFAVRGSAVHNDALREDAEAAGITSLVRVIDSGSDVGGTVISLVGPEMRRELMEADVVIAKGQGNFETLSGCGLNIYYLFLCKCPRFIERFHLPKLTGVLVNERRM